MYLGDLSFGDEQDNAVYFQIPLRSLGNLTFHGMTDWRMQRM
jgi:hypothetical protein